MPVFDYLIVGAGFAGSVMAERLARVDGAQVLVIDRRPHIGGNAHDYYHESGILVHKYGPHAFHTNSRAVFDYLSQFTEWRPYEHRVRAVVGGRLLPFPINLDTINAVYGIDLNEPQAAAYLHQVAEPRDPVTSAEDHIVSQVGWRLYRLFFEAYTHKQWGVEPRDLPASVAARIPVRTNRDDRYFTDLYQAIPTPSYNALFERLLEHRNITVRLNSDHRMLKGSLRYGQLIYTGSVDELYGHRHGRLPYRSLRFEHLVLPVAWAQSVAQLNYPRHEPHTRTTEHKHLTGQQHTETVITYEYPSATGEPYYPLSWGSALAQYERYATYAAEDGVILAGRLGSYRYSNMDQVVLQALALFDRIHGQSTPRKPEVSVESRPRLPC